MASSPVHLYTFDEYLDLERKAEYKSEFHYGEVYARSGGTDTHAQLSARMSLVFGQHLRGCRIYDGNLNLYIESADRGVYPDCTVICGAPTFWRNRRDVVLNPTVVVEVLSPSSLDYDQGTKAHYYRSVPSVEHILLVSQDRLLVDHFARQNDHMWTITQHSEAGNVLRLLGSEITLQEIYQDILTLKTYSNTFNR